MESVVVVPGDAVRMASVVGSRKNCFFSGSTSGTSLQECLKNNLKSVPLIPTMEKHRMLGSARVKDESRTAQNKSFLALMSQS